MPPPRRGMAGSGRPLRIAIAAASGNRASSADRDAPADDGARERDAQPPDQPADDERRHVVAHRPRADPGHERLDDVRRTHREQPRHAEPLQHPADEERFERRRERDAERRRHEQQACEPDRARAADPVGDRPPDEPADRDRQHDEGDREPGARRADVEVARELGQDRLRRVHRREHPGRAEHEAGERLPSGCRGSPGSAGNPGGRPGASDSASGRPRQSNARAARAPQESRRAPRRAARRRARRGGARRRTRAAAAAGRPPRDSRAAAGSRQLELVVRPRRGSRSGRRRQLDPDLRQRGGDGGRDPAPRRGRREPSSRSRTHRRRRACAARCRRAPRVSSAEKIP